MLSDRIHLLSPRPARVEQTIAVPLPRARFSHSTARAEAATIETSILDFLLSPQINDQEGHLP
ncbi:hypothetical protein D3C71_1950390 [compost metagenome]